MKVPGMPSITPRYSRCIEICLNFGTPLQQCREHCRKQERRATREQRKWAQRSIRHLGKPLRIGAHRDVPDRDRTAFVQPLTPYERRVALFGSGMDPTGMRGP